MTARPGSVLWLLRHELRLTWRGTGRKRGTLIAGGAFVVFLHLVAIPMAIGLHSLPSSRPELALLAITAALLCALLGMVSTGLVAAVQAIYARGDMDLLLSSPLAPRSIIIVRAASVATTLMLGSTALVMPFANVLVVVDGPRWLAVHVALIGLAMLATSMVLALALGLFQLMGARRTRVAAQIVAGLVGFAFVALPQLPTLLSTTANDLPILRLSSLAAHAPGPDSWVWLPAKIVSGGPLGLAVAALMCLGALALTTLALANRFVETAVAAASAGSAGGKARPGRARAFRGGAIVSIIRAKELRLLLRDPWLLTQFVQQVIFLVPLGAMLWKSSGESTPAWALLVMVAGTLAGGLAWLTVCGEDAPDLLKAAPLRPRDVLRAKVEAALIPVALVLVVPLVLAWRIDSWLGVSLLMCSAGSALSCALLNVLFGMPGKRREFNQRGKRAIGRSIAEFLLAAGWAVNCLAMTWLGGVWPLVAAAVLLALPGLVKASTHRARNRRVGKAKRAHHTVYANARI